MAQYKNKTTRASDDVTTSVKPLGNGRWGARVCYNGRVIDQDNSAESRQEAAANLKELLRWVDKMGRKSLIAEASRGRACRTQWSKYPKDKK